MYTKSAKTAEADRKWIVVDADGAVVGRLATFIAKRLRGKHRADFTPHADVGDFVVVINADKVKFTGKKMENKRYYRHTGHPGGIKETSPAKILGGRFPERVLEQAVLRMLPKESPLARDQFKKLRVYAGAEHPHEAQNPTNVDFKSMNSKNVRGA
ncbi:50S ribosomal protein L13 [Pseudaquidulcibacter saccharophilus]|uniref:50S ribosomal protein L13 n=1 Tax=Pseudaquidulcibacter saccharophilus TaxID=2831900 RepID=UPI001EFF5AF7|nr:50S ribosomal protein L13 [Pseudaquidulcibacter saccharophilus]